MGRNRYAQNPGCVLLVSQPPHARHPHRSKRGHTSNTLIAISPSFDDQRFMTLLRSGAQSKNKTIDIVDVEEDREVRLDMVTTR